MVLDALVEVILPLGVFLTRPLLPIHVPVLRDGDVEPLHRVHLQVLVLLPHPGVGQGVGGSREVSGQRKGRKRDKLTCLFGTLRAISRKAHNTVRSKQLIAA